jgi:hypothetical protein
MAVSTGVFWRPQQVSRHQSMVSEMYEQTRLRQKPKRHPFHH